MQATTNSTTHSTFKQQNTPWTSKRKSNIVHKKNLAIDWNSTEEDQINCICQLSHGLLSPSDFNQWNPPLGHKVGMSEELFNVWAWTSPLIQWRAKPYLGVAKEIARLGRQYNIWIVTSTSNPKLVEPWHRREGIYPDRIIITDDKNSVDWDIIVEDNPFTLARLFTAGRNVIRRALLWNDHLSHIPSFNEWNEIWKILPKREDVFFWHGIKLPKIAFGAK